MNKSKEADREADQGQDKRQLKIKKIERLNLMNKNIKKNLQYKIKTIITHTDSSVISMYYVFYIDLIAERKYRRALRKIQKVMEIQKIIIILSDTQRRCMAELKV